MEQSYIIIASKHLPHWKGFRVHGEKDKAKRLEKLKADGYTIREIRLYHKHRVNA